MTWSAGKAVRCGVELAAQGVSAVFELLWPLRDDVARSLEDGLNEYEAEHDGWGGICWGCAQEPCDCSNEDYESSLEPYVVPDAAPVPPGAGEGGDGSSSQLSPPSPLSWAEWAVPAILTELDKHAPLDLGEGGIWCCTDDQRFSDWQAWFEHVAPLIAERLERATLAEFPKT